MKFERIIKTKPPYDKRHKDPSKNYGISSLQIWFVLKKGEKAVQILISTNSYLASVQRDYKEKHPDFAESENDYQGYSCYDVGYHSNTKQYKGQSSMSCDILKNKKCYYDGSSLLGRSDKVAENYIKFGDEWVWNYLKNQWNQRFGLGEEE